MDDSSPGDLGGVGTVRVQSLREFSHSRPFLLAIGLDLYQAAREKILLCLVCVMGSWLARQLVN